MTLTEDHVRKGLFTASLLLLLALAGAASVLASVVGLGSPMEVESKALGRTMQVVVHLPDGYDTGSARYPVLYMMGSDWRSHFALAASTLDMMSALGQVPATILVGIDLPDGNGVLVPRGTPPDTTAADAHLAFLADEVIPQVGKRYRTEPFRILYGASNSGLFTVYALLSRPLVFNAYLASSPMLGWCDALIVERARRTLALPHTPARFLAIVYSDDDYDRVVKGVPALSAIVDELKPAWLAYTKELRANEGHVPTVDLALSLKAVFPDYNPPQPLDSVAAIAAHYEGLSKRYGFVIAAPPDMVFDLGMQHVVAGRLEKAREVFEQAVATFPAMSRAYVGLGLVYERQGDTERALQWFRRAVEVDPDDSLAARQVARLSSSQ